MGADETPVGAPHVDGVGVRVGLTILVEDIDDFLFGFSNAVLKGLRIGLCEVCEMSILLILNDLVGSQSPQISLHFFKKTRQGKVNMGQLVLVIVKQGGEFVLF
jgi:hypothetical protein